MSISYLDMTNVDEYFHLANNQGEIITIYKLFLDYDIFSASARHSSRKEGRFYLPGKHHFLNHVSY